MTVERCDICARKVCLGNCPNYGKLKTVVKVEEPAPVVEEPKEEKPKAKPKAKKSKKSKK